MSAKCASFRRAVRALLPRYEPFNLSRYLRCRNAKHGEPFVGRSRSANLRMRLTRRSTTVDLALRLNVLAICAVFVFVGAILLGAF